MRYRLAILLLCQCLFAVDGTLNKCSGIVGLNILVNSRRRATGSRLFQKSEVRLRDLGKE